MRRARVSLALGLAAVLMPSGTALAHGGSEADVTSNYKTRVLEVPAVPGLDATAIGLDGRIRLTWNGDGTLIVLGYQEEPYLKFDASGVWENRKSPATFLNQDRYGQTTVPDTVDADAEPQWVPVSATPRLDWHDHRIHWMSTALPPAVRAEPSRSHVIYERWEIALSVNGEPAVIAGDLSWSPAPPLLPYVGASLLVAGAALLLLWKNRWRLGAVALSAIGTVILAVDTAGFVAQLDDSLANRIWAFLYSTIALLTTARLALHAARRTADPPLAVLGSGLVLVFMGGLDRFDVLTSGYYLSTIPISTARVLTVACLGIGAALVARFLFFLTPLLIRPRQDSSTTEVAE